MTILVVVFGLALVASMVIIILQAQLLRDTRLELGRLRNRVRRAQAYARSTETPPPARQGETRG